MTHRVAVIGLGYFSKFHLDAWMSFEGVDVVGATDLRSERKTWAQENYGIPVFDNTHSLLATQPDIVDIVAPPQAHARLLRAVEHPGRVVICQKPFCTTLDEAQSAAAAADRAEMAVLVHENFRFQPWYRTIKCVLDGETLGDVYQARFALRPGDGRGQDAYLSRQPVFQTMPRLLIHETGVHFIDLFRWLFGEIDAVYADLKRLNPVIAGEDAGQLVLDHASGVRSIFDGNRLSDHATDNPRRTMGEFEIEGTKGTLYLDGQGQVWMREFGSQTRTPVALTAPVDDTSFGGGCVAALNRHVIDALEGKRPFENTVADYLPVIAVKDAAYLSAQDARKIQLKE